MKKVLVTGGTGFIGRYTLQPLLDAGFEVRSITHKPPKYWIQAGVRDIPPKVLWNSCDLLNPEDIRRVLDEFKPEYLLHFAWDVTPGYKNNSNNLEWMNASLNLIHQFANNGGRKVVIAGTCFDHEPNTLYGTCKRSLWNILNYANFANSLELAYGRIYYLYGPHEAKSRLIPTMINGLLNNEVVKIKSLGSQVINLSYVQDVAESFVKALDTDIQGEFDLLGNFTTIDLIAQTLIDLLNLDSNQITLGTENLWESTIQPYDTFLATKLDNIVKTSLVRGLTKTIDWWKEHQ